MTRQADPTEIAKYREKLMTNPASLLQNLKRVRENLRERSEVLFIDRDLTADDQAVDEETRTAEFERIDEQILRVGARIDDLDKQIEAHNKAHPDAELAAKLMEAPPPGAAMSGQQRRELGRQRAKAAAKAEKNLPVLPPTDSVPVEGEPSLEPDPNAKLAPVPEPTAKEREAARLREEYENPQSEPEQSRAARGRRLAATSEEDTAPETAEEAPAAEEAD